MSRHVLSNPKNHESLEMYLCPHPWIGTLPFGHQSSYQHSFEVFIYARMLQERVPYFCQFQIGERESITVGIFKNFYVAQILREKTFARASMYIFKPVFRQL